MIKAILISIVLVAIAVGAIAIKILLKKNGKFAGTCAGNSEFLKKEGVVCPVCGAKPGEDCKNPSESSS